MSNQAQTGNGQRQVPKIDMDAPIQTTGADIPAGTYPGTFLTFGEAKYLKSAFDPSGEQLRMTADFYIRLKDGTIEPVDGLVGVPEGGKIHRKSNLHKLLKALANGDTNLWDSTTDGIKAGTKLSAFRGRPVMIEIKMGGEKKDFPTVAGFMPPIDGPKYPTKEEIGSVSEGVPF